MDWVIWMVGGKLRNDYNSKSYFVFSPQNTYITSISIKYTLPSTLDFCLFFLLFVLSYYCSAFLPQPLYQAQMRHPWLTEAHSNVLYTFLATSFKILKTETVLCADFQL